MLLKGKANQSRSSKHQKNADLFSCLSAVCGPRKTNISE